MRKTKKNATSNYAAVPDELVRVLEDAAAGGTRIRYWEDQSDIWGNMGLWLEGGMGVPEIMVDVMGQSHIDIRKLATSRFVYKLDLPRIFKVTADRKVLYLKDGYEDPEISIEDCFDEDDPSSYRPVAIRINGERYDRLFDTREEAAAFCEYLVGNTNHVTPWR